MLNGHAVDAQHLDSAYKAKCELFLTSDKTDIWSRRGAICTQLYTQLDFQHLAKVTCPLLAIPA